MKEHTALSKCTLVTSWILTSLGLCSTASMLAVRILSRGTQLRVEDVLVPLSFLLAAALIALSTWAIASEGQGSHQDDISVSQVDRVAKSLLVSEALWSLINGLIRISACIFLHRIFDPVPWARRALTALAVFSGLLAVASILQIFLICRPFAANWDHKVLGACGDQMASFMAFEALGLALDVVIVAVPTWLVLTMRNMAFGKRVMLMVVFDVGIIVIVVTGLRMGALYKTVDEDFTYSQSYLSLLSAAGTMTAIVCCASPIFPQVYNEWQKKRRRGRELGRDRDEKGLGEGELRMIKDITATREERGDLSQSGGLVR